MIRSVKQMFVAALSLLPAARAATAQGTGVDLQGYGAATLLVTAGAYTDGSHAITLEESNDNATFTAVSADERDGSLPTISSAGTASQCYRVGYLGTKRYIRPVTTVAGATTGAVYGVAVLLHDGKRLPK